MRLNTSIYQVVFVLAMILSGSAALLTPINALGADPFDTEADITKGRLDIADNICNREKIRNSLSLGDVVDLALCNNPQTRSLWSAARVQAAQMGVYTAAYLPTLSAQASVTKNFPVTG